jgi:DNA-directed RNA polymerase subunit beta'
LPRVEEIFETRPPKRKAIISDESGKVIIKQAQKTIEDENGNKVIVNDPQVKIINVVYKGDDSIKYYFSETLNEIKLEKGTAKKAEKKIMVKEGDKVSKGDILYKIGSKTVEAKEAGIVNVDDKYIKVSSKVDKTREYMVPKGTGVLVEDGEYIEKGSQLTEGSLDLQQLYKIKGQLETQKYIIKEIKYVYSSQGQPLNDKHVEIIAKQMFSRFLIVSSGGTDLLPGEIVESAVLDRANKKAKNPAKAERLLLGMTKASLTTDSFLSSASFQQTAQVLIEAAINGKIDYLEGLKENVIIGCLIPAGTGYKGVKKREIYE